MSDRIRESPGYPERTGTHPATFAPAAFAPRPVPPYPIRSHYAAFDPALPRAPTAIMQPTSAHAVPVAHAPAPAPAPTERRGGSEPPPTGRLVQDVQIDGRPVSISPTLENAPFAVRERLPYPTRTMSEITTWMPRPLVEPRRCASEAIGASDPPSDWRECGTENIPQPTYWEGFDRSNFARYGGREDPNETAAFANNNVVESIEAESDPLIALRRTRDEGQAIIRRELDRRGRLEDHNRALAETLDILERDYAALERSQEDAMERLTSAEEDRDRYRRERNRAQTQVRALLLELNQPEEALRGRQDREDEYEQGRRRQTALREQVGALRGERAELRNNLQTQTAEADRLRGRLGDLDDRAQGLELQRNHWEDSTNLHRYQNGVLQAGIQNLTAQLVAARALANRPPVVQAPAYANPHVRPPVLQPPAIQPPVIRAPADPAPNILPPVVQPPVAAHPVGPVRGGRRGRARGRAARGRGGAVPGVRNQPGRSCKVEKNYKD